jgi:hypothetical protein
MSLVPKMSPSLQMMSKTRKKKLLMLQQMKGLEKLTMMMTLNMLTMITGSEDKLFTADDVENEEQEVVDAAADEGVGEADNNDDTNMLTMMLW